MNRTHLAGALAVTVALLHWSCCGCDDKALTPTVVATPTPTPAPTPTPTPDVARVEDASATGGQSLPATGGEVLTALGAGLLLTGLGARRALRRAV